MPNSQRHILIAEDDPGLLNILRFNLQAAGFQVTPAREGLEAWEAAQNVKFDLVLSDYQMPNLTGVELVRRLRGLPEYLDTPIMLMTALSKQLDLPNLCDHLNVLTVFPKPFSPAEVVTTIKLALAAIDEPA